MTRIPLNPEEPLCQECVHISSIGLLCSEFQFHQISSILHSKRTVYLPPLMYVWASIDYLKVVKQVKEPCLEIITSLLSSNPLSLCVYDGLDTGRL